MKEKLGGYWSVVPVSLPFLSLGPIVEIEPQIIRARTSNIMLAATLGAWRDLIVVDSRTQTVRIRRTKLWGFVSVRHIAFSEIGEVAYSMIDGSVGSTFSGERDGPETFDVALTLHSGEEVPLMRFSGDGEYVSDVPYGLDYFQDKFTEMTDARGNQQEKSLGFVELLSQRIGVPLGSSRSF